MQTLTYWGDDLLDVPMRRPTWLGQFMLESGTTPSPIVVAKGRGVGSTRANMGAT